MGRLQCAAIFFLFLLPLSATARGSDVAPILDREAFLKVTVVPLFHQTGLTDGPLQKNLSSIFDAETSVFAMRLAEGLSERAFHQKPRVLGREDASTPVTEEEIENPDSFTIRLDVSSSFGLSEKNTLGACLSTACFFSPLKLFSYESRSRATLTTLYTSPNGERILVGKETFETSESVRGNFFDVMSAQREIEWVESLHETSLNTLLVKILEGYPERLRRESWSKAADYLSHDPLPRGVLPLCRIAIPQEKGEQPPLPMPARFEDVVRMAEPSIFEVRTERGVGSGFVISNRGYGVTSLHTVKDAEKINVRFQGGEVLDAKIAFESLTLDLAVLALSGGGSPPLPLGSSNVEEESEPLVALGYVETIGLTAIRNRIVSDPKEAGALRIVPPLPKEIAGCPLVNFKGEIIGIYRRASTEKGEEGIVIPVEEARKVVEPFLSF